MTISTLVDLVKIYATTTGSGTITFGAAVDGYRGVEALANNGTYSYSIVQNDQYEAGQGFYIASGNLFVRSPIESSDGGTPVALTQNAIVNFTALAQDVGGPAAAQFLTDTVNGLVSSSTATLQSYVTQAQTILGGLLGTEYRWRPSDPATGPSAGQNTLRIGATPVQNTGTITTVKLFSKRTTGVSNVYVGRYSKSGIAGVWTAGDVFTLLGSETVLSVAGTTGLQAFQIVMPVNAGDWIGWYSDGISNVAGPARTADDGGYYAPDTAGHPTSFAANTLSTGTQWQISFQNTYQVVTGAGYLATVATVNAVSAAAVLAPTRISALRQSVSTLSIVGNAIIDGKGDYVLGRQSGLAVSTGTQQTIYELGLPTATRASYAIDIVVEGAATSGIVATAEVKKTFTFTLAGSPFHRSRATPFLSDAGTLVTARTIGDGSCDFGMSLSVNASGRTEVRISPTSGVMSSYTARLRAQYDVGSGPMTTFAPKLLGTIVVNNEVDASSARLDPGYQLAVVVPWKAGLAYDFSNLRIFGPDRVTELSFYVAPEGVVYTSTAGSAFSGPIANSYAVAATVSAKVWIAMPGLPVGKLSLYYDGGAAANQSNGYTTFPLLFDDGIDPTKWAVSLAGIAAITPQGAIKSQRVLTKASFNVQAIAVTPYGIAATLLNSDDTASLYMIDPETGNTLYGPVATAYHAYLLSYDPDTDYLIASPTGSTSGNDGKTRIHKASDLSQVGTLYPAGYSGNFDVVYGGPGKILTTYTNTDGTYGYQFYAVNYSTFTVTAGAQYRLQGDPTQSFNMGGQAEVAQGYAFNPIDGRVYNLSNSTGMGGISTTSTTDSLIRRFSLNADMSVSCTGRWRYVSGGLGYGTNVEPEGICFDQSGAMFHGGTTIVGGAPKAMLVFRDTLDTPGGSFLWVPPVIGGPGSARLAAIDPIGPVAARAIFGFGGIGRSASPASSGFYPDFGLISDDSSEYISLFHSSIGQTGTQISAISSTSGVSASVAITLPSNILNPNTFEVEWDGTAGRLYQNEALLQVLSTNVPPLAKGVLLKPTISSVQAGSGNTFGAGVNTLYVALAKPIPANQSRPTFTTS